jgi:hypothetical protein
MESDHYDATNLVGCPGQQFSTAPSFALWTHVPPCCHTCLIYFVRFLLILILIPIGVPLACLAIAVILPITVVCLPCICCFMIDDDLSDSSIGELAGKLLWTAAAFFLFVLWVPFALLFSPIVALLYAFSIVDFEPWLYLIGPAVYPLIVLLWHEDD